MKTALICATMLVAAPVAVQAQTAPAEAAPAEAASATLNGDSPIEAIAADPAGKAAFEKHLPDMLAHPAYEQFKGMSLRQLAPLSGGIITDEKIAAVEAELKAAE